MNSVATNIFQVMPPLSPDEFSELKSDIQARGVMVPIEYDEAGNILDGHHRVKACKELGIKEWPSVVRLGMDEAAKRTHARKLNMARRHLNQEQRRGLIQAELKDRPQVSDRQIAKALGVSNSTVSVARKELVEKNQVCELHTSTGKDGKEYPRQVERKTPEPELPIAVEHEQRPCLVEPDTSEEELIDQAHQALQWLNELDEEDEEDDAAVVAPVIPASPPPVSTADPRQLGYIGAATPVAERDSNDWHTPAKYIAAVKSVMGGIDLDPFSSVVANETVQATRFFTAADDAFTADVPWRAVRLFMNPPYGRGVIDAAIARFLAEWAAREFQQAVVLVNNATETHWFQTLMQECEAVCFTDHRIAFVSPDNKQESGNTRGQAFFYFGERVGPFIDAFYRFGAIAQVLR